MPVVVPLVELGVLAVAFAAIALALLIVAIMKQVGNVFRPVPVVGGYIAGAVSAVAQAISYVLGKAEAGVDAAIGASWHALAWFARSWWHEIEAQALGYLHLVEQVARMVYAHTHLRALVHSATQTWHGIEHGVKTLERKFHGIEAKVRRLEHDLTKGIGHDLRIGLRDLEKEVHGIEQGTIPAIRSGIGAVEGELTALQRFIGAIPGVNYLTWAEGIVAAVIGLGAIKLFRCSTFLGKSVKRGCGLWDGIEDVLGLFFDVVLFVDFCALLPNLVGLFGLVEQPLVDVISTAADAVCAQPPPGWVHLTAPPVYGPTPGEQAGLALAG